MKGAEGEWRVVGERRHFGWCLRRHEKAKEDGQEALLKAALCPHLLTPQGPREWTSSGPRPQDFFGWRD